ncbi:ThiF family adenylyltransferase, partial [bacterium]|nr:ThiF family adenylyltransferase [bacterium]
MNDRYQRQTLFEPLGPAGQARLRQATVAVVGCGALGTHVAEVLTRAGAGRLVLVDRDIVEWTNLHRQALFIEDDAREGRPKAIAAAAHLAAINGEVELVPHVSDLSARNIDALLDGAHVVCDGSDNVETRYLLNDWAVARGVPWVYGGAVGPTA